MAMKCVPISIRDDLIAEVVNAPSRVRDCVPDITSSLQHGERTAEPLWSADVLLILLYYRRKIRKARFPRLEFEKYRRSGMPNSCSAYGECAIRRFKGELTDARDNS